MLAPTRPRQADHLELLKLIRPWSMRTQQKLRVGNPFDGGYVLPAAILNCDAVVSIGIGHDVSFDHVLAERGATILQYDHTVDGPPTPHARFRFHKKGWGSETQACFLSFTDIHAEAMSLGAQHPMLKFDIEGAEYDALDATDADLLKPYEIIACEFHDFERLTDPVFHALVRRVFEKLNVHHAPVHLHANNCGGLTVVEGIAMPRVLEVAWLRRDLDTFAGFSADPIPGPLDRPNHPGWPDLCLNAF